jgi:hypothetical protein
MRWYHPRRDGGTVVVSFRRNSSLRGGGMISTLGCASREVLGYCMCSFRLITSERA